MTGSQHQAPSNSKQHSLSDNTMDSPPQALPHSCEMSYDTVHNEQTPQIEKTNLNEIYDTEYAEKEEIQAIFQMMHQLQNEHDIYDIEDIDTQYGIYEDVEANSQFINELIDQEQNDNADRALSFIHNMVRVDDPSNTTEKQLRNYHLHVKEEIEINKVITNEENENEQNDEGLRKRDASQVAQSTEEYILPAYVPTYKCTHESMLADSNYHNENEYKMYQHLSADDKYNLTPVNDQETFIYDEKYHDEIETKGKGIPMIEATFITKSQEATAVYLENKPYVKITYNTDGYTRGVLSTGHEIPIQFDNGANCNIIPKAYYDQHPELHHNFD
ncbi:MAG: hypothetical protein MJA29_06520 [Candidatus Omnitrophica bacterium]|nr:hypothetical protein [Candidatus Omnitrophota bacterium]